MKGGDCNCCTGQREEMSILFYSSFRLKKKKKSPSFQNSRDFEFSSQIKLTFWFDRGFVNSNVNFTQREAWLTFTTRYWSSNNSVTSYVIRNVIEGGGGGGRVYSKIGRQRERERKTTFKARFVHRFDFHCTVTKNMVQNYPASIKIKKYLSQFFKPFSCHGNSEIKINSWLRVKKSIDWNLFKEPKTNFAEP